MMTRLFGWFKTKPEPTTLQHLVSSIELFRLAGYKSPYLDNLSMSVINTYYPTVVEYSRKLELFSALLESNRPINAYQINNQPVDTTLKTFFMDANRCYLDTDPSIDEFTRICTRLLQLYESIDSKEKDFTQTRNLSLLQGIRDNLLELYPDLIMLLSKPIPFRK